ncbi:hypothetical protein [Nannocystis pusilla]|uniref:hypothetical protein n=1 Tax=Nannocystis pusilla TaxID=889268 RepID=UPI003B78402E
MDKRDLIPTSDLPSHELELVDLDDLRAAFGGQNELAGAPRRPQCRRRRPSCARAGEFGAARGGPARPRPALRAPRPERSTDPILFADPLAPALPSIRYHHIVYSWLRCISIYLIYRDLC